MNYKQIFETMVEKTQRYLEENNLLSMVLGISGGIDSTLTAAICHEIEKKNPNINFYGISLPCTSNTIDENNSATQCMKAFCKDRQWWVENLQKEYSLIYSTCSVHGDCTQIGKGNIKARLRMIYLYDLAQKTKGVVMDTDNLTEHFLGFFTIHGDVADLNPIGNLWKHEVYELVEYLRNEYYDNDTTDIWKALNHALNITPTDGNGVNNLGDMGQIAPAFAHDDNYEAYKKVDYIVQTYLNDIKTYYEDITSGLTQQLTSEKIKAYGQLKDLYEKYGMETVDGIISRIRRTEYKRKRLPIVL